MLQVETHKFDPEFQKFSKHLKKDSCVSNTLNMQNVSFQFFYYKTTYYQAKNGFSLFPF